MASSHATDRPAATTLARYALAAYAAIVVYATLYPLAQWRIPNVEPFAFLSAPWPRYFTWFDVLANIAAYFPLGMLLAACIPRRGGGWRARLGAVLLATLAGACLSVALEALQSYLPSRVPSNFDVLFNAAGAFAGALAFVQLELRPNAGLFLAWRDRWFRAGPRADAGLTLLALWLFGQLNPEALLFGTGDLRDLFAAVPHQVVPPDVFVRVEAIVSGANLVAIALIAGALVRAPQAPWKAVLGLIVAALAVRSLAFAVLAGPEHAFLWLTPGAMLGLLVGGAIAVASGALAWGTRLTLAGVLLMAATAIVNVAPSNPYAAASVATWRQGHFLNFNGLTWTVSAAWPFAAMAFLLYAAGRRTQDG